VKLHLRRRHARAKTINVGSWPSATLHVAHEHHHTYGKRPRPEPPDRYETWVEVDGAPVSGRLVFQAYGHAQGRIDIPQHYITLLLDRLTDERRQYTQVTVCVQPIT
jgi:hypothetical protein